MEILKLKKDEIVKELLAKGVKIEDISGLRIKELRNMLEEESKGEDSLILLDQIKETEETIVAVPISKKDVVAVNTKINDKPLALSDPPVTSDPGWTQYVMGLFMDDELEGENPRLEGLRRITELLIGEVTEERSELISSPTPENGDRACSKAILVFSDGRRIESLADACSNNCTKDFAMYPVAMSDTRSKARAYRTALRLKRIVSAEEIGISNNEEIENPNRLIQVGQLTAIRLLADRSGVSIHKLLTDLEISCVVKDGAVDLKMLKYSEALVILNRLNSMRQEEFVPTKLKK